MKDKPSKEKRVSWGKTRVERYSVTDKNDSSEQLAESDSTLPKTYDFGNLKNVDNHILFEESIKIEDDNPFLEESRQSFVESVKILEQKENFDKNLTNKLTNSCPFKKEPTVNEESIFATSVKSKINLFEKKSSEPLSLEKKQEKISDTLDTPTFNAIFASGNESEAVDMDTQKLNEFFPVNKPTKESVEEGTIDENNTINIKKYLNLQPFNPYDELIKRGIRFYTKDKISFKRVSVYQSSQSTNPSLFYYHKYFTKPFFNYLSDFKDFLIKLHSEMKEEHFNYSNLINQEIFKKENIDSLLKELKGLSSTIYKITWYNLRREREIIFNNLIKSNKIQVENEFKNIKEEKEKKEKIIEEKEKKVKELQERLKNNIHNSNLHSKIPQEEQISLPLLKKMISDNKSVNDSYKKEIEELNDKMTNNLLVYENLTNKILFLSEEIKELDFKVKNRNVGEKEYLQIRDKFKKIASISGLEIIKAYDNVFVIKVGEYMCEFIISPGNILLIEDYNILSSNKENKGIFNFFVQSVNLKNDTLRNAISKLLEINDRVKSIIKDINMIKFNSIINYNEENETFIIKIKKFNKKIEEKEIIIKIKKDFRKEVFVNNEEKEFGNYGYISEAFKYV